MNWRILIAVGLACTMALPATAVASHMTSYRTQPVEHDNLGRSHEPDFASTSVLGPALTNCVVDAPPFFSVLTAKCGDDASPTGLTAEVAPGCTDDPTAGVPSRVASGLCGLWSIGLRPNNAAQAIPTNTVGENGMSGAFAPGAFTPTKTSEVTFLDGKMTETASFNRWAPVQEIAGDAPVAALNPLRDTYTYTYIPWAWIGKWTDSNGNGVIDHQTTGTAGATVNEFVYYGGCVDFNGVFNPPNVPGYPAGLNNPIAAGICAEDINPNVVGAAPCFGAPPNTPCGAKADMQLFVYPGNHHGGEAIGCAGAANPCVPTDIPGNQVLIFALNGGDCEGPPSCDDTAKLGTFDGTSGGDTLLDNQFEVTPDDTIHDRTADTDVNRHWVGYGGNNGPAYDDGTLTAMTTVFAYNCGFSASSPNKVDLSTCTFIDVDSYISVAPAVDAALNGAVKPPARGAWTLVTAATPDTARLVDSVVNGRLQYEVLQGPLTGQVNDLLVNPGFSREPNNAADSYPGVAFGPCGVSAWPSPGEAQHRGYCNTAAFDALSGTTPSVAYGLNNGAFFRGWSDHQLQANLLYYIPVSVVTDPCTLCSSGAFVNSAVNMPTTSAGGVDAQEDHTRTIMPGQYYIQGITGVWRDGAHDKKETVLGGLPDPQVYLADGWIGFLARQTGQFRYRGYNDVGAAPDPLAACVTERGPAAGAVPAFQRAMCNPYLDGNVGDPQDYTVFDVTSPTGIQEEWQGRCDAADNTAITLTPSGPWGGDIVVWRSHGQGLGPLIQGDGSPNPDWPFATGGGIQFVAPTSTAPIVVTATCFGGGANGSWQINDFLIWPAGNKGVDVTITQTVVITLGADVDGNPVTADSDTVTDTDFYRRWTP